MNIKAESKKMQKVQTAFDALTVLTIDEVPLLIEKLAEIGIKPAAVAVPAALTAEVGEEKKSEKQEVNVVLKGLSGTAKKLEIIKIVKNELGMGLKQAKDFVATENLPVNIKENLSKSEAEEMKKKLEAAGAEIELQ